MTAPPSPGRYHLTLTVGGRPAMHGWWADETAARRQHATWVRERSSIPGARIALVDTEDGGRVLASWPTETDRLPD